MADVGAERRMEPHAAGVAQRRRTRTRSRGRRPRTRSRSARRTGACSSSRSTRPASRRSCRSGPRDGPATAAPCRRRSSLATASRRTARYRSTNRPTSASRGSLSRASPARLRFSQCPMRSASNDAGPADAAFEEEEPQLGEPLAHAAEEQRLAHRVRRGREVTDVVEDGVRDRVVEGRALAGPMERGRRRRARGTSPTPGRSRARCRCRTCRRATNPSSAVGRFT